MRAVLPDGIVLDYDEQAFNLGATAPPTRGGSSPFDETPAPIEADSGGDGVADSPAERVAASLVARGVVDRASTGLALHPGVAAPDGTRSVPDALTTARLTVPLADGENAVVLLEGDGVLTWRFGTEVDGSVLGAARRGRPDANRALVFDIDIPPIDVPAPGATRGFIRERLVKGARAIVLYFAAQAAVAGFVRLLDGKRRTGPVVIASADDPREWGMPTDYRALTLPGDRPARVLLLVHGTFSSTIGGFGELTATPWGQRFLRAAISRYDAVIGFDHRTLAVTPLDNARELMEALSTLTSTQPIVIDAVSHSRGGLVLRSLTERVLPNTKAKLSVERAVFVAATNHGTELARPENWKTLVDLVTNLASISARVIALFPAATAAAHVADEVIDSIGEFVKFLVEVSVEERAVPGVAAMDPAGAFVRDINVAQTGRGTPGDMACYAIVSDFYAKLLDGGEHEPKEWPSRLAFVVADGAIDRLMRGSGSAAMPNDLVVDVASMTHIDAAVGGTLKDVHDYGRNALVYHTNYFLRPETAARLAQWLHLPSPVFDVDTVARAGARRGAAPVTVPDLDALVALAHAMTPVGEVAAQEAKPSGPLSEWGLDLDAFRGLVAATRGGLVEQGMKRTSPPRITVIELNKKPSSKTPATVYVTAEMPGQVRLARECVVTVTLSAEQVQAALGNVSDQGKFVPDPRQKITVHVIPRSGFDYAPSDTSGGSALVGLPAPGSPAVLDFMLRANEVGAGSVSVAIRQGALRMLTLNLQAQVVDNVAPSRASVADSAALADSVDCGICPTLEIFDRRNGGQLQYEFILRAGGVNDRFRSDPIQAEPRAYVDARYAEIEKAWRGSDRAADRFTQRLQAMGGQMFRELFPPKLRETLWRLAGSDDLDDILVHSDEPFLPWEIVYLDDPAAPAATGKGRFFGELGLCRWLFGAEPVCAIKVRPGKARYVIPHYPDPKWALKNAETIEEPMLRERLGALPVAPTHAEIVALLQKPGAFDLLHFACHGQATAADIEAAALLLQGEMVPVAGGGRNWGKESLLASTVAEFADLRGADGNRPLVVVNACQAGRLGYTLTGLGGFATAFLGTREGTGDSRGRAGAFVGALWSVGDQPASEFVAALYRELQAGKTIAQATRVARSEARDAGDGSWLAYTVYAHPQLRVRFD